MEFSRRDLIMLAGIFLKSSTVLPRLLKLPIKTLLQAHYMILEKTFQQISLNPLASFKGICIHLHPPLTFA